jgi:hypothetical protein
MEIRDVDGDQQGSRVATEHTRFPAGPPRDAVMTQRGAITSCAKAHHRLIAPDRGKRGRVVGRVVRGDSHGAESLVDRDEQVLGA